MDGTDRRGRVIVMGSGELAPGLVATHRAGIAAAGAGRVLLLDTPYGFQENADLVTQRYADYMKTSLDVDVDVASLRSPAADVVATERFLASIRRSRYVFAGPGSPSYAVRIWNEAGAALALQAVVEAGGTLTFASAAALTLGRTAIPVYEIYKVGEEPAWLPGLDVLSALGLPCTVVPHWDNAEGGNHDTSRCYIGERRFGVLERKLDVGVVGVDEHTAAVIDFGRGELSVAGRGTVTLRGPEEVGLESGASMPLTAVAEVLAAPEAPPAAGAWQRLPDAGRDADAILTALLAAEDRSRGDDEARRQFRAMLVDVADAARRGLADPREPVAGYVELLLEIRGRARDRGDFGAADAIRDALARLGVEVQDTPEGSNWSLGPIPPG